MYFSCFVNSSFLGCQVGDLALRLLCRWVRESARGKQQARQMAGGLNQSHLRFMVYGRGTRLKDWRRLELGRARIGVRKRAQPMSRQRLFSYFNWTNKIITKAHLAELSPLSNVSRIVSCPRESKQPYSRQQKPNRKHSENGSQTSSKPHVCARHRRGAGLLHNWGVCRYVIANTLNAAGMLLWIILKSRRRG